MILSDEQRDVCKLAIEIYGVNNQVDMCLEEMSELTKALLKYRRYSEAPNISKERKDGLLANIIEEIADVIVMCEQMAMVHGEDYVEAMLKHKIDRLAGRLHKEV